MRDRGGAGDVVDAQLHLAAAGDQIAHRAFAEDASLVDDGHAVAGQLDLGEQMRRDEDAHLAFAGEAAQQLADLADAGGVEAVGRLVEDEQLRIAEQRLGDAEALAHAEGVGSDALIEAVGERHGSATRSISLGCTRSMRAKCSRFSRPVMKR